MMRLFISLYKMGVLNEKRCKIIYNKFNYIKLLKKSYTQNEYNFEI